MNTVTEVKTNPHSAPQSAIVHGGAVAAEATQKLAAGAGPEARLGNGRFFANQTFHFEALRALGYMQSGGAEAGEVLETVGLITEGDVQSWYACVVSDRRPRGCDGRGHVGSDQQERRLNARSQLPTYGGVPSSP